MVRSIAPGEASGGMGSKSHRKTRIRAETDIRIRETAAGAERTQDVPISIG